MSVERGKGEKPDRLGLPVSLFLLGWATVGCAGPSAETIPPERRAVEASRGAVARSVQRGLRVSDDRDSYRVPVRLNPPRCPGPDWEIYAHGRWTRVYLEAGHRLEGRLDGLRSRLSEGGGLATATIEGAIDGRRRTDTGLRYPVFYVTSLPDG